MNMKLIPWVVVGVIAIAAAVALSMPASATNKDVGNEEFARLQGSGAMVVDVRTEAEFAGGHIPGAVNVPVDQIQEAAAAWDKSKPVALYCATGGRSASAAGYLAGQGFREVYNLKAGIAAWNGETVAGSEGAAPPAAIGTVKTNGRPLFIDFSSTS